MKKLLFIPIFLLTILGCRTVNYNETVFPDGTTEKNVRYHVFGLDTKVGGLSIEATRDTKKLTLQDLDTSSANAMGVIGRLVDKVPSYGTNTTVVERLPPVRPTTNPTE